MTSTSTSPPAPPPDTAVAGLPHRSRTNPIYLVLGCTVFAAGAQVLLKFGAMHPMPGIDANGLSLSSVIAFLTALLGNWQLLVGYSLHACNAFLLILALRDGELSMLYPIIALTYVWVNLLSMYFFHEHLNLWKCVGIALVIGGVALLGKASQLK
jgi:multidrug transporter EmrE-like cation transporter